MPGSLRAGEVLNANDGPARARRAPPRLRPRRVRTPRAARTPRGASAAGSRSRRRTRSSPRSPPTLVASAVLLIALARHDFTFAYVAEHTSHNLPLGYTLSAFWGGQEGSLLLWLVILTGYAALAVWLNRRPRELMAWTVPVFGLIAVFFTFMLCFVSSPFHPQPAPADGAGMVPSLQNPYMLAHPPMLYLGYVGLAVPFAFAMGALLSGRTDERWIVATRRWTLAAWTFLGVGQLLGSHWAYTEIGWGGYYAWDPVENAALMPWLAATAFLHSVMIQEKRGMLKVWNMVLVALAFNLSLFGTFLTRSGVIDSIHSFSQSSIGGWFLGFLVFMIALLGRAHLSGACPLLRTKTKLESLVSREATFLYNNLLLVALALTILWGSSTRSSPRRCAARRARSRSRTTTSSSTRSGCRCCSSWGSGRSSRGGRRRCARSGRRSSSRSRRRVVTGGVLLVLGFDSSWPGLLAYTFSAFVLASIVLEFVRGRAAAGGIFRLVSRTGGATAATSSTPRSCFSRSASPARARTRRCASGCSGPGSRWRSPATRSRTAAHRREGPDYTASARCLACQRPRGALHA